VSWSFDRQCAFDPEGAVTNIVLIEEQRLVKEWPEGICRISGVVTRVAICAEDAHMCGIRQRIVEKERGAQGPPFTHI